MELPAGVGPGRTWSGSGSAGDTLDYVSSMRAGAGSNDCLQVDGELTYTTKTGRLQRRVGLTRTWCPRQGLVASTESFADLRIVSTRIPPSPPHPRTTAEAPIRWREPQRWTSTTYDTLTVDRDHTTMPMNGTVDVERTPVRTASGLVVRAMSAPRDLVATTPKTPLAWTPAWRAHPGGQIVGLAAFGDAVLVTTSRRELMAYSDAGVRLWSRALTEIAPTPAVRVSGGDAVLVDLAGVLRRFDIATGVLRWTHQLRSDVTVAPAAGAGLVVVADRGGTVTAVDADNGATRWQRSLAAAAAVVVVVGPTVAVVEDQRVHGLDAATGRARFVERFAGTLTDLRAFAGQLTVSTKTASFSLSTDGRRGTDRPGYLALTPTATYLAGWATDRLDVIDTAGRVVARFPTPSVTQISSSRPGLATPEGVFLFGDTRGWTFQGWTRTG